MVNRALQFATSDPQGPVYLYGVREPMEEDLEPYELDQSVWHRVAPVALPQAAIETISEHLVAAKEPLLIVGYTGRNVEAVREAVSVANTVKGLRVLDTGGSDMYFPADHPASLGLRYGADDSIRTADFILVVDCDIPWIPSPRQMRRSSILMLILSNSKCPCFTSQLLHVIGRIQRHPSDSFTRI